VAVFLLEVINGFKVSVKIVALVIPRVARVMNVLVGPYIGKDDLPGFGYIRECIEDVSWIEQSVSVILRV